MAGFWAGFGTQFSKDVGEIRKELREDSRSRKNYMDQYGAKTIANAQAKSDEILSMVNQSVAMGVDEQAMLGIYQKSGAKGIRMFHKALLERPNLSIDDYQSISKMGREWVKDTDLDLTDVILRGMNVYHDPNATRPERDENFLQGIISGGYGDDSWMDEARFARGMTPRDVKRIEAGVSQSATEGSLDIISMLGPKPLGITAESRYENTVLDKFKKEWVVARNRISNKFTAATTQSLKDQYNSQLEELKNMKDNGFQSTDLNLFVTKGDTYDPGNQMFKYMDLIERERRGSMSNNSLLSQVYGRRNRFAENLKVQGLEFASIQEAQAYANRENYRGPIILGGILRSIIPDPSN
jgi:hypothetical protein